VFHRPPFSGARVADEHASKAKGKVSMKRFTLACLFACMASAGAADAFAQSSGAPPGNVSPDSGTTGKSAGFSGGAGAAGQAGTDPRTLARTEEERLRKKNAQGASGSGRDQTQGARKDPKE
jgi:hypothetical protein